MNILNILGKKYYLISVKVLVATCGTGVILVFVFTGLNSKTTREEVTSVDFSILNTV